MSVTELHPKSVDGPANISAKLRELADRLEAEGTARTCLVTIDQRLPDEPDRIDSYCFGYRPTIQESMGLHQFAICLLARRIGT